MSTLVAGLRAARALVETSAMRAAGAEMWSLHDEPFCSGKEEVYSQRYWECYVRHWALTVYHPVGTCAMGTVVDNR